MPRLARPLLSFLLLCALTAPTWAEEPTESDTDTPPTSAEDNPPTERPPLPERSQQDNQALQRQLPLTEQQPLQAGAETFLALWLPANSAAPKGAVILLPGDLESADWPQAIGPLRRKLPDDGWHSLSLSLPDPASDAPPLRRDEPQAAVPAEGEAPSEEGAPDEEASPATEEAPAPEERDTEQLVAEAAPATPADDPEARRLAHAERVLARIDAAIALAQQQQAPSIVLLGHGSGAYWAARYLSERQPDNIRHLLLVSAALPAGYGPPLDELIPTLKLPSGDFYYKDQLADRQAASRRMQASKRQQHPTYIQVAMKALPGNREAEQEQLYRRIRGWLNLQIQGK